MKSITFYKLISPYSEDITKNCGLSGAEIDRNFMNLKEMDIVSASTTDNNTLTLTRVDGEEINIDISSIISGMVTDFSVTYDETKGIITIKHNGETDIISGLCTLYTNKVVYSNQTLEGDGIITSPLKVSPVFLTGVYAPCNSLIDLTISGNTLPSSGLSKGDRYLTKEKINKYGYLYNFCQLEQIEKYLEDNNSEWRIPSKEDWDNMLNGIEECDQYRNHNTIGNGLFGKLAGKKLKSTDDWEYASATVDSNTCTVSSNTCDDSTEPASPITPEGIDSYSMKLKAAGYGYDFKNRDFNLFGEEGVFWTKTVDEVINEAYTKTFDYDKTKVGQELTNTDNKYYCSIRLVKDWTGGNQYDTEEIAGNYYGTALIPTLDVTKGLSGYSIWTTSNLAGFSTLSPITPNGGNLPESSFTTVYYTNEWDGEKWLTNTLKDDYSVVLKKGLSGDTDNEYRNINGILTSVSDVVYKNVLEALSATTFKDIYDKIEENKNAINVINNALTTEIQERKDADAAEILARTNADNAESLARTNADAAEILARTNADNVLQEQVTYNKNHLVKNGEYNITEGTLTLKANDEANNIVINLTSNYGNF